MRIFHLLLILLVSTLAQAQDLAAVRAQVVAKARENKTLSCDFRVTKRSSLLKEPAVTTGHMTYTKPYAIAWQFTSPSQIKFTTDGQTATVTKDGGTKTIDLKQSKMYKRIKKMTGDEVGIESLITSDKFDSRLEQTDDWWLIVLTPNKKELETFAKQVVLHADKKDSTIKVIVLTSKSGDTTTIELTNIKTSK